jgi:hypothetical protein
MLDAVDRDAYSLWCQDVVAWLQQQFGSHLMSVVEHSDERFFHLHYFVVPELNEHNRLNVNQLHPGCRAKAAAEAAGAGKKAGDSAYRAAMRGWQDDFHSAVSAFHRHDRFGPKRMRVSRQQWRMEKEIEEKRAHMLEEVERQAAAAAEAAQRRAYQRYAEPYQASEQRNRLLTKAHADEKARRLALEAQQQAAQAEIEILRAQLAALAPSGQQPFAP